MADIFTNKFILLTSASALCYTAPSNSSVVVTYCQAANINTASNYEVSLQLSSSDGIFYAARNIVVPNKASVGLLSGQLILSGSDQIYAFANANSIMHLTMGFVEHYD